eukprot:TRINITY_DN3569_c0_g2_i4.p2 TRINITY_DN3569_c0_g2~~TRINITY_DN3569_c0_g2_i4.p2  ORF type:complete len:544 (-),score=74.05 TRINITY_DN3569_c0_g2_i4:408-1928(-)
MLAVALLHDVLDDTEMTESMLAEFVSRDIVDKVLDVSKLSTLSQLHRDAQKSQSGVDYAQVSNLYIAMAEVEAVLVKLADRLHNMQTLDALPKFKRLRMAQETMDVFVPIANRLGIWWMKSKLEDLCFSHLHPEQFERLKGLQKGEFSRVELESFLEQLQNRLSEKSIAVEDLYGRTKSLYGVYKKLKDKELLNSDSFARGLYDLRGIRIIVRNKADCYKVAREVERLFKSMPGRYKDYIRYPKDNGYQSLHLGVYGPGGVPVEVQIRTAKMHYLAEYGVAAHWGYKEQNYDRQIYDKQQAVLVRYKRWLTQKLKLHDMKLRPNNKTSFDHSFDSLALDSPDQDDVISGSAPTLSGQGDAFTKYMLEHRLLPAPLVDDDMTPITVVCSTRQTDDQFRISYRTFPPKSTVKQFLDKYTDKEVSTMQVLINNKFVTNYDQELSNGDVVEVRQQESRAIERQDSKSVAGSSLSSKLNADVRMLEFWDVGKQEVQQDERCGQDAMSLQGC